VTAVGLVPGEALAAPRPARVAPGTLGRNLGPAGAAVRLLGGGLLIAGTITYAADHQSAGAITAVLAAFALTVGFYLAFFGALADRVLPRIDPWFATVLFLAPLWTRQLAVIPASIRNGMGLYVGVGLLVTVAIRYGGCEVVAIPSAVFRRRYTIYCPYNVVDAAERPFHARRSGCPRIIATAVAVSVGGWYLIVSPLLEELEVNASVPERGALLLLLPALIFALVIQAPWRQGGFKLAVPTLLGIAALVYLALTNSGTLTANLWPAVMAIGVLCALGRLLLRRRTPRLPAVEGGVSRGQEAA
jgi:hypothetical protein